MTDLPHEYVRKSLQFEEIKRLTEIAWNTPLKLDENAPAGYLRDIHDIVFNWVEYLENPTQDYTGER